MCAHRVNLTSKNFRGHIHGDTLLFLAEATPSNARVKWPTLLIANNVMNWRITLNTSRYREWNNYWTNFAGTDAFSTQSRLKTRIFRDPRRVFTSPLCVRENTCGRLGTEQRCNYWSIRAPCAFEKIEKATVAREPANRHVANDSNTPWDFVV